MGNETTKEPHTHKKRPTYVKRDYKRAQYMWKKTHMCEIILQKSPIHVRRDPYMSKETTKEPYACGKRRTCVKRDYKRALYV